MTLSEYNDWAKTKRRKGTRDADWRNAALGFAGEFGEICDLIKKHEFHGYELDKEKLKLELGDLLFYLVWLWDLHNTFSPLEYPLIKHPLIRKSAMGDLITQVDKINYLSLFELAYANYVFLSDAFESPGMSSGTFFLLDSEDNYLLFAKALKSIHQIGDWFFDQTICDTMQANVDKLNARYPNGFSEAASQNRVA